MNIDIYYIYIFHSNLKFKLSDSMAAHQSVSYKLKPVTYRKRAYCLESKVFFFMWGSFFGGNLKLPTARGLH